MSAWREMCHAMSAHEVLSSNTCSGPFIGVTRTRLYVMHSLHICILMRIASCNYGLLYRQFKVFRHERGEAKFRFLKESLKKCMVAQIDHVIRNLYL